MKQRREKFVSNETLSKYSGDLKPQLEKAVVMLGFRLLELSFRNENQANYLRLTINHLDRNISLDDCEFVSKKIEKELDSRNLIPFSYILEVQSPGINKESKCEHEFVLEDLNLVVKA